MHIIEQGGVVYPPHQTMTSPDLVAIINSTRDADAPKLRKESYMTQLPEHQQRVVAEKQELDEKLGRLIKFVRSAGFTNIVKDAGERERLMRQETIMRDYSMILGERINHF